MQKLIILSKEELKVVFHNSKELKEIAKERTEENEFFWIEDKLNILKSALNDWSFGIYERNFWEIKDDINKIIEVIDDYIYTFSASEEILEKVKKQKYSTKLLNKLIEEEIENSIKYLENLTEEEYFENFYEFVIDNLENYYINSKKELIKIEKVS